MTIIITMASFGYDDLFNDAHFRTSASKFSVGGKAKFIKGAAKYKTDRKSHFSESIEQDTLSNDNVRFVSHPKARFVPKTMKERFMTDFNQTHFIEDNHSSMSDAAISRAQQPRGAGTGISKTRFLTWSGLNSS